MATYKCKRSYSSLNGNYYTIGKEISQNTMNEIPFGESSYWEKISDDDIVSTVLEIGLNVGLALLSTDLTDSSSGFNDSGFDGFGDGGSFGGGGASGDW